MELIFENEQEMRGFFRHVGACPTEFGYMDDTRNCSTPSEDCVKCWMNSGVKYRIKGQPAPWYPVSIEEQKKNGMFATFEALHSGDAIVKCGGGWYIERKKEEPKKQVYISTASHPDPLVERMLKNMLNTAYGKDGVRPFVVMPRHCGRTAAYSMIDEIHEYCKNDVEICMDAFRRSQEERRKLQIEKVIFHDPATIVYWKDGTKTVVKVQNGDMFDPEKGLAMAICKKVFGNDSGYYEEFKKWLPEEENSLAIAVKRTNEMVKKLRDALNDTFNVPVSLRDDTPSAIGPCDGCNGLNGFKNFEGKEEKKEPSCSGCKYSRFKSTEYPCSKCNPSYINFKPKDAK